MTSRRLVAVVAAVTTALIITIAGASPAGAHPLGNFTVNRHVGLLVSADRATIDYIVDLAEIPTAQAGAGITADVDGFCSGQAARLDLTVGGSSVPLTVDAASIEQFDGEAGLPTVRVSCRLGAALGLAATGSDVALSDRNEPNRLGWREIVVIGDGVVIDGDVRTESPSAQLTSYPDDALATAPDDTAVSFAAVPSAAATAAGLERVTADRGTFGTDAFTSLFADAGNGVAGMGLAIAVAALLGALHAMAPGHGKAVIGAYLVGTKGTRRQAFGLAIAVALSHTLGVLVLGVITLWAGATWSPERVFPWLQAISAVIVLGIGIWLTTLWLRERRASRKPTPDIAPKPVLVGVGAGHDHHHDHDHHHHHDHHHDHRHHHDHGHHHHDRSPTKRFEVHRHGIFPHVHRHDIDRLALDDAVSWKTLALLGLSGGLVPSTSAIIVLLAAVQIGRIAFGGALILAFGIGMSVALVGVGLGVVALSNRAVGFLGDDGWGQRIRTAVVPIAAVSVLLIGLTLSARAVVNL